MVSAHSTNGDSRGDDSLVEIGSLFRKARVARKVSYEEVSRSVRIRPDFLRNLEMGQLDGLPERVYVRGFIKTYGNYLGLDGEALAERFASTAQIVPSTKPSRRVAPPSVQLRPVHAWLAYVLLIVGAVGGITVLLERNGTLEFAGFQPQTDQQTDGFEPTSNGGQYRDRADTALAPSSGGDSAFPTLQDWTYIEGVFPEQDNTVNAAAPPPEETVDGLILGIQVVDAASWVKVVADRRTVFEGTLQPGFEQQWEADESLVLLAGNAGGVLVTLNNEDVGRMGGAGEVREQQFTRVGDGPVEIR